MAFPQILHVTVFKKKQTWQSELMKSLHNLPLKTPSFWELSKP